MNALAPLLAAALAAAPTLVDAPGLGKKVGVHAPEGAPVRVVLLLSGAGGADAGTSGLAAALAARGALVVEIDAPAYLASRPKDRCVYPAGDLEVLAQHVEKLRALPAYLRPVLVGHSQGAALALSSVATAPSGSFAGAVAVAPCPDRPLPVKLCTPRDAARRAKPPGAAKTSAPAEIVAGASDEACRPAAAEGLASGLGARFTKVAGAGHALGPALDGAIVDAVERIAPPAPAGGPPAGAGTAASVSDLPLVEVPSSRAGRRIALLITGDGGWVGADKALASALADGGVSVVGLDSLKYFWKRRTPEETTADVSRILAHYREAWRRDQVVLVGYSRGADIVPILAERFAPEDRARLVLVAMLGPSTFAEFEVHAIDLFSSKRRAGAIDTEPAVRATNGYVRMVCFHGEGEKGSLCPKLADLPWVIDRLHGGGHRLGSDEGPELVRDILAALPPER